jgi:hypothetical protein|tara:strand:- start:459 stop:866 length:408 start_codon:yes stop_codon:yes gene_type:complete
MYLEIEPTKSGKTTRLVDAAVYFLLENADKVVLIVTPTNLSRKNILKSIHNKCGDLCSKRVITSYKMLEPTETIKQFVDEFDNLLPEKLFLDREAYYTTTTCNSLKCKEIQQLYENGFYKVSTVTPNKFIKKHEL